MGRFAPAQKISHTLFTIEQLRVRLKRYCGTNHYKAQVVQWLFYPRGQSRTLQCASSKDHNLR